MKTLLYKPLRKGHHVRIFDTRRQAINAVQEEPAYWGEDMRLTANVRDECCAKGNEQYLLDIAPTGFALTGSD